MAGWRKGPRCEVSNCPSRLWNILDGRRVCKNGHISASVELLEDDDDLRGHKRLKQAPQPQLSQKEETQTHITGIARDIATASICGAVLREQVRALTDRYHLPIEFEQTARSFFIMLANSSRVVPDRAISTAGTAPRSLVLEIQDSVCILRLALAQVGAPLYYIDLARMIDTGVLPYNCLYTVPALSEVLTRSRGIASGYYSTPPLDWYQARAPTLLKILGVDTHCEYRPLVYKIVRDLMLPPVVYTVATNVLKSFKLTIFDVDRLAVAAVVFAVKALYQVSQTTAVSSLHRDNPDWDVWSDMVHKIWIDNCVESWDEKDALFWDEDTVDIVLNRYRECADHLTTRKDNPNTKQLHNMFPVPEIKKGETYDLELHRELMVALYESSESGIMRDGEKCTQFSTPSNQYIMYSRNVLSQWVLPPVIETLYRACSQFLKISELEFRQSQYGIEKKFYRSMEFIKSGSSAPSLSKPDSEPPVRSQSSRVNSL